MVKKPTKAQIERERKLAQKIFPRLTIDGVLYNAIGEPQSDTCKLCNRAAFWLEINKSYCLFCSRCEGIKLTKVKNELREQSESKTTKALPDTGRISPLDQLQPQESGKSDGSDR